MAVGKDLLNVAMVVGGGYILIYHVLPALQSGQFPGFTPGGEFLPPAAATGHKCWEIGNGSRACACAGKQWFQMGSARQCPDCITYCNTGAAPGLKRPTSNPTPPKQTGSTPSTPTNPLNRCPTAQFSANCVRNTACQYCWVSSNKTACTPTQSCTAARAVWLSRFSSGPTNVPPTRPTTGPASGTQATYRCTPTRAGTWNCTNMKTGQIVGQGIGWKCNGLDARNAAPGHVCTTIR